MSTAKNRQLRVGAPLTFYFGKYTCEWKLPEEFERPQETGARWGTPDAPMQKNPIHRNRG